MKKSLLRLAPLALLACFVSCITETQTDQYLTWHLSAALKNYHLVNIRLNDAVDTATVLEEIYNDSLPDPEHFPKHKLRGAKGRHFVIRITCFDAALKIVWAKHIEVEGNTPKDPVDVVSDLRLANLTTSLDLTPAFAPDVPEYRAQTPESTASFFLMATPMDASNGLTVKGATVAWGSGATQNLDKGENTIELKIASKSKSVPSRVYRLIVTRAGGGPAGDTAHPVISVGPNTAVHLGDTVVFPISVTVQGGTIACFKYDLEGDGIWDNTDTVGVPASLKHAYPIEKDYTARFFARSAAGIEDSTTRAIKVTNAKYRLAITSPGRDTIVNHPITVTYTVNDVSHTRQPVLVEGINIVPIDTGEGLDAVHQSVQIILDPTLPSAPAYTAEPPLWTNAAKGNWAWKAGNDGAGSGLSGRYRYSQDGGKNWTVTSALLLNGVTLIEGSNTFALQEEDKAGNWSASAPSTVRVDRTPPRVDTQNPVKGITTKAPRIVFTGSVTDPNTASIPASGIASVTVSGQQSGQAATTVTNNYWQSENLVLALGPGVIIVTATDNAGNIAKDTVPYTQESGTDATAKIHINSPANGFTTNKDTVTVEYTVDGGAAQTQKFTLLKDGDSTLVVEALPAGGGLKGYGQVTVTRDTKAPDIRWVFPDERGMVTNKASIDVLWDESDVKLGEAPNWVRRSQTVALPDTGSKANDIAITTKTDAAGNFKKVTFPVYRHSGVIFISEFGAGISDGSSWYTPRQGNDSLNSIIKTAPAGTQLWLMAGKYTAKDSFGIQLKSGIGLFGGFDKTGLDFSIADRDKNPSLPNNLSTISSDIPSYILHVDGGSSTPITDVTIDGMDVYVWPTRSGIHVQNAQRITLGSLRLRSQYATTLFGITGINADLSIAKSKFIGWDGKNDIISAAGANFSMTACEFSGSTRTTDGMARQVYLTYTKSTITNSKFLDAVPTGKHIVESTTGAITLTGNTFKAADIATVLVAPAAGVTQSGNTFTP